MDQSTVTRTVRPLVRDGFVRMTTRAEDRRTRVASLSAKGRAALAKAVPLWRSAQRAVIERVGEDGWASLRDALQRLAE
jgi:DNA-binding MarR family transcriptional regulator